MSLLLLFQSGDAAHNITAAGDIAGAEAFGSPAASTAVAPSAVASGEAISSPSAQAAVAVADGIAGAEAFGSPVISIAYPITEAGAIASAEATGSPTLTLTVVPASMTSAEAISAPAALAVVAPADMASAESFDQPVARATVSPADMVGAEAFGVPYIGTPHSITDAGGILDDANFGEPVVSIQSAAQGGGRRKPKPPFQWMESQPWPYSPKYWLDINVKEAGDIPSEERFGVPRVSFIRDPAKRVREEELLLAA